MNESSSFFERVEKRIAELPKKQARLAEYIVRNYRTAALLASVPLGKQAGVSEATVIRLAHALGYGGFLEMSRHLRTYVKDEITTVDKMRNLETFYGDKSIFREVIKNNTSMLNDLQASLSEADLQSVVDKVSCAENVYVAGFESASGIAEYIGYNFVRLRSAVSIISAVNRDVLNAVKTADKNTVAFIITFPRYARDCLPLARQLKERGATVIGITDSVFSPVKEYCDTCFIIPLWQQTVPYLDTSIAVITLFQIIFFLYGKRNPDSVEENLKVTEEYSREFGLFQPLMDKH